MSRRQWIGYAAKALTAGAAAALGCLATGAIDGSLDLAEWLTAAASAVTAAGAVYGIPNTTKGDGYRPRHAEGGNGHARR